MFELEPNRRTFLSFGYYADERREHHLQVGALGNRWKNQNTIDLN